MRTRTYIAGALLPVVNSVLFGAGAIAVLSIPALEDLAAYFIPAVVAASFAITPLIAWRLAPRMRLNRAHRP
ncbi:hypothetical protein [Rhizobium sp. L1K21]|uniref:hypothetical protein n=1 Tax=Rhizobium sp. L1K21 TaxID=2954933 RepID=UPI002092F7E4|nr:hypothetical protein [Rhizobium sp. L1K21]MCO6188054.1 hypothetical protein [Rhizobium sp. L1K21]